MLTIRSNLAQRFIKPPQGLDKNQAVIYFVFKITYTLFGYDVISGALDKIKSAQLLNATGARLFSDGMEVLPHSPKYWCSFKVVKSH